MLSFFRRGLSSWFVLGLLGLIMVAFVITGVGTPSGLGSLGGSGGGERLATVGDEAVTAQDVTDQLQRQLSRIREQQPEMDMATLVRTGTFDEIVNQLIGSKAMVAFGREQGIAA